jgi:hypothetical protein
MMDLPISPHGDEQKIKTKHFLLFNYILILSLLILKGETLG